MGERQAAWPAGTRANRALLQHTAAHVPPAAAAHSRHSRSAPASRGWCPLLRRSMSEKMGRSLSACLLSQREMEEMPPELLPPGGGGKNSTLNLVYP